MEALVQFVGAFTLEHGKHDDYWVDAVFSEKLILVDESLEFEYDESFNPNPKPKDRVQRKSRSGKNQKRIGSQELDG
jgi:hypothetical protein